jgi:hypothetical protein
MRNITVTVEDQTYHDIRLWCAARDVSVSRLVKTFLQDLHRLKDCRRFPLPAAPDPGSLAALFDELNIEDLARLRQHLRKNSFPGCETVNHTKTLIKQQLGR